MKVGNAKRFTSASGTEASDCGGHGRAVRAPSRRLVAPSRPPRRHHSPCGPPRAVGGIGDATFACPTFDVYALQPAYVVCAEGVEDGPLDHSAAVAGAVASRSLETSPVLKYRRDAIGLALASGLFGAWLLTLLPIFAPAVVGGPALPDVFTTLLGRDPESLSAACRAASTALYFALRVWLTTGLFVTVHDAIHHQVAPRFRRLNHGIGAALAFCYASFPYTALYRDHWRHHRDPTAPHDPDFYKGGFWRWLSRFLAHYSTFWQLFWESAQFWGMCAIGSRVMGVPFRVMVVRVACVWAIPALLSGVQLFFFGTFLPHRNDPPNATKSRSNDWPYALSLASCFHFGACHEEHHAFPDLAWWELPGVRAARRESRKRDTNMYSK